MPKKRHTSFYKAYLRSDKWKAKKARLIVERGGICERCKQPPIPWKDPLQLHHLTYIRLGNEWDADLQLVHKSCHKEADRERKASAKKLVRKLQTIRRKIKKTPKQCRRKKR